MSALPSNSSNSGTSDRRPSSDSFPGKRAEATSDAGYEAELQAAAPVLRGRKLTAALAFVAGTGFTLFGCVHYIDMNAVLLAKDL